MFVGSTLTRPLLITSALVVANPPRSRSTLIKDFNLTPPAYSNWDGHDSLSEREQKLTLIGNVRIGAIGVRSRSGLGKVMGFPLRRKEWAAIGLAYRNKGSSG